MLYMCGHMLDMFGICLAPIWDMCAGAHVVHVGHMLDMLGICLAHAWDMLLAYVTCGT